MEKLISMTGFVKEVLKFKESEYYEYDSNDNDKALNKIESYNEFLLQPLTLGMFVPCSLENGMPLNDNGLVDSEGYVLDEIEFKEYQKAKERVLFEGFGYDEMGFAYSKTQSECGFDETYMQNKKVEDLVKYNLVLTESAKKQIGLTN